MASALSKSCFNFISILIAAVTHRLLLLHLGSQVQHLDTAIIQLCLKFWRLRQDWNWAIIRDLFKAEIRIIRWVENVAYPFFQRGAKAVDLSLDQSVCSSLHRQSLHGQSNEVTWLTPLLFWTEFKPVTIAYCSYNWTKSYWDQL